MNRIVAHCIALIVLAFSPYAVLAQEHGQEQEGGGEMQAVMHHVTDSHQLDFSPFGSVSLPRILVVERNGSWGLDVFASTGSAAHSDAYHMSGGEGHGGGHLVPEEGSIVLDLSFTKYAFYQVLVGILLLVIFGGLARQYKQGKGRKTAPKGIWQNIWEVMIVYVRDEIAKPTLGRRHYQPYMPYLLSVFFFILFCNLIGLVPFGATATSSITVTATLAVFTFVVTQFAGTKEYWKHIFWPPGPVYIKPLMIPVEILGLFTKPFALAIRLFANMTAGHLVILNFIVLIFVFANLYGQTAAWGVSVVSVLFSLFLYALELLVAFIQAYVFTILSGLFIGMAIEEHHEEEHAYDSASAEIGEAIA